MAIFNINALQGTLRRGEKLMGLDLGSKTIGLALSDTLLSIASPLETIQRTKFTKDALRIEELIRIHEVGALVMGMPLNMDGTEGPRCQSTRDFITNFQHRLDIPIALWDERLSTSAVERMLVNDVDMTRKRRGEVIDKLAATYILQGALDALAYQKRDT
ncbi:Holliday junction resolvase RuvX [Magnetovibrio blakemorei]|uniref:Putative pre-16S rRNA nuclease n=1 Tax=Magnetovibrio blakemorei TaxID=28181 RepID=A0A1E5Q6X7_9PROT|nr:Holliday junction resolvase RuvX [Magnetovibrio blakemorei]OEJ66800.1 Holliday junction DNA helicase RuvA [Magnetovibrio blakemorei]